MSQIVPTLGIQTSYRDRKYEGTDEDWKHDIETSTTLYVGNLAFFTTEEQIYQLFSKCGELKRIIMGLDRLQKTPCGFCFVEYYHRKDAIDCVKYISGTKLDDRIVRADIDPGFKPGRQFGRGRSGGQVRDEYREEFDAGRGGWSASERIRNEQIRTDHQKETYASAGTNDFVPTGAQNDYRADGGQSSGAGKRRGREDDDDEDFDRYGGGKRDRRDD